MLQNSTLELYPTSRAIRVALEKYLKDDGFIPTFQTIGEFENKATIVKNKKPIDDDTRVLLLQKACDFSEFKKLNIPTEFFSFLKNSSFIFSFLDELSYEKVDIDELFYHDTYLEYDEHLSILKLLRENYIALLEQEGCYDKLLLPQIYEINEEYIKSFSKIVLNLEGYLSAFELELFLKVSKLTNLVINFQKTSFNDKMMKKLGVFEKDIVKVFERENIDETVELAIFKDEILQVSFIKQKVYEYIKSGVKPENIAVVLPDKSFAKFLQDFDFENNFNYAFGYDYTTSITYKRLDALYRYQVEKSIENEYRLRRYFEDISFLYELKSKSHIEILKSLNIEEDEIYDEELYVFSKLLTVLNELSFEKVLHLFLKRLSKRTIDDVRGGKITVLEVLETRGVGFEAIVIPNFNESKVPKSVKKDMFISSSLRSKVGLPTIKDRENLQKQLYQNVIYRANKVAISYVENEQNAPSRFLDELDLKVIKRKIDPKNSLSLFFDSSSEIKSFEKESLVLNYDFKKIELSSTRLKTFLECRRKYYYKYIKNINDHEIPTLEVKPYQLGNILHLALKKIYQKNSSYHDDKSLLLDLQRELYSQVNDDEVLKFHIDLWLKRLSKFISSEIKRFLDGFKVLEVEKSFVKEYRGFKLVGQIDRIDTKNSELYVLDYKTGKIVQPTKNSWEKSTNFQLQFYSILANTPFAAFYDLNSGEVVWENFFDEKMQLLDERLKELEESSFDFYMTEDIKTCEYCPYKYLCGRVV